MRFLLASVATLIGVAVPGYAHPGPQSFKCVGTGFSEGYPYGRQDTGPVQLLVTVTAGTVSVIDQKNRTNSCPTGAKCTSSVSVEAIGLSIRDVPNSDPLYSSSFRMDIRNRKFVNSGGGLDGGWSQKGKCKALPAREQRTKVR